MWIGHVARKREDESVKITGLVVSGERRKGRTKKIRKDAIGTGVQLLGLLEKDAFDRIKWRGTIS